jgi:hypothetical protein
MFPALSFRGARSASPESISQLGYWIDGFSGAQLRTIVRAKWRAAE